MSIVPKRAFICDLDGLLVDSEQQHFEAYRSILAEYGIPLTKEEFIQGWLSGNRYGLSAHLQKAGMVDPIELKALRKEKSRRFIEGAQGKLRLMSGAKPFLEQVKRRGVLCGVGTGAHLKECEFIFDQCGLYDYIEIFVGGDQVENNKPSADIFLKVAEKLNVSPHEAIVFENSSLGVAAARAANMRCIIVPSEFTDRQDFSGAEKVLKSLEEVDFGEFL